MEFSHRPVMPEEVIKNLGCGKGGTFVDGTVGGAGHSALILEANPQNRLIGFDRDEDALEAARERLKSFEGRFRLVRENFRNMEAALASIGEGAVDGILLDLGVSSYQFDRAERGFSFRFEARLDMRMDRREEVTAYDIVNTYDERELERIFRIYGEEAHARKIARGIVSIREKAPIETTTALARIIVDAYPARDRGKKIHPATKVFQALRMAVNQELESLEEALYGGLKVLKAGGRMAVISFHSLEDRMVKQAFREAATGCICPPKFPKCVCGRTPQALLVTRKAIKASEEEIAINPRARSARLRAIEKL